MFAYNCDGGRATKDSDVDLLVEFSVPVGWEFTDLRDYFSEGSQF